VNYSDKIFEMLGVEPNEKFKVKGECDLYYVDENLKVKHIDKDGRKLIGMIVSLSSLLAGEHEIIKLPKYELSDEEIIILLNTCTDYNWVARDKDNILFLFKEEPHLVNGIWYSDNFGLSFNFYVYNHLFKFIKPGDRAYNIDELIEEGE